jgi:hypothetical protein
MWIKVLTLTLTLTPTLTQILTLTSTLTLTLTLTPTLTGVTAFLLGVCISINMKKQPKLFVSEEGKWKFNIFSNNLLVLEVSNPNPFRKGSNPSPYNKHEYISIPEENSSLLDDER